MRDFLTKSQRALFQFLRDHPGQRFSLRHLQILLDQAINTIRLGLRVLQQLGWLITKVLGGPWHAAAYECTEEGLKVVADVVANLGADSTQQIQPQQGIAPKTDTTICPFCAARLWHDTRASTNSEDVSREEKHKAYKLAPADAVEKANEIETEIRLRAARARLQEIQGKPLDEFSVSCMVKPLLRLPEPWQVRESLEEFEEQCVKERERPKARHWGFLTKVIVDEVARFVGRIPPRKPAERADIEEATRSQLRAMGAQA